MDDQNKIPKILELGDLSNHFFNISQSLHRANWKSKFLTQRMFLSNQLFPTLLHIYCKQAYSHCKRDWIIATLGPSWNFSLAENLKSLSLQDGPRSGIIIGIVTIYVAAIPLYVAATPLYMWLLLHYMWLLLPSHRISLKVEYLSNQWLDWIKIWILSLGDQTKIKNG